MLSKRYNWIPLLRARNIGVNSDPSTRKDGHKTTPNDAPDRSAVREIGAVVFRQRTVVDRWDGVRVNKGPLNQVVDKQEEQHCDGRCEKRRLMLG